MKREPAWLDSYFQQDYLDFVLKLIPAERTARQAEFLTKWLPPPSAGLLLDVGCGIGRHVLALAARGYEVTGLDQSPLFLEEGRQLAAGQGLHCRFLEGDMRDLPEGEQYAAVLFLWSTFGYFSDEENLATLAGARRSLPPGGRLCLDLENREYILRHFQCESWKERGDGLVLERNRFDLATDTLYTRKLYLMGGERRQTERRLKLYPYATLLRMLSENGFEKEHTFGSWEGDPYQRESRRLLVFAGAR